MDIKQSFVTNEKVEQDGVWVDIGDGSKLLVARMYNPRHTAAMRQALAPYKRRPNDIVPQEILDSMMAKHVLLDWKGITENGEDVPYSVEKAEEYLAIKDFRALVVEIAGNMETYRAAAYKDAEKN